MNLQELLRKRAKFVDDARELIDTAELEGRGMTEKEKTKYELYVARAAELTADIKVAEKEREEQRMAAALDSAKEIHKGIALRNSERLTDRLGFGAEERQIADQFSIGKAIRGISTGNWNNASFERRALESGTPTSGGYLLPLPVSSAIIDSARDKSVCVALGARTVPMNTGRLTMARVDADPDVYWRAEGAAITEDVSMAVGAMEFTARSVAALVRCNIELLEDAENCGDMIFTALTGAIAAELDRAAMFGTGADDDMPLGIVNTTGISKVTLTGEGAPLVGYGNFVKAAGKILEANGTPGGFAMSPRSWVSLQNSLSGEGQFILIPPGIADMKFRVSSAIPNDLEYGTSATNTSCIIAGGWENLYLGMRTGIVLEASRVAGSDTFSKMQVLVRAYLRADVQIARAAQFCVVEGIAPSVG